MTNFVQGNPDDLRDTILFYADFPKNEKLPNSFSDELKNDYGKFPLALFGSSSSERFVSGIEIMTRDSRIIENAKKLVQPDEFGVNKVYGMLLPFRRMYYNTHEGDIVDLGKFDTFKEGFMCANQCFGAYVVAFASQNGQKSVKTPNVAPVDVMKTIDEYPKDKRVDLLFREYVQPITRNLELGEIGFAYSLAQQMENVCYNTYLNPEAKNIIALIDQGELQKVPSHLELLLAIADGRFEDAARIKESLK